MSTAGPDQLGAGRAWPLGASVHTGGVNFAVPSAHAERIDLCLFDDRGQHERVRHRLPARTGDVWHGFLPGATAGLVYGLRAHGRWAPHEGDRFNAHKLLLDPWAREIVGRFEWRSEHFAFDASDPTRLDPRDNAALALKARVVHDRFDWQGDEPPSTPIAETVLYELQCARFHDAPPARARHATRHLRRPGQ